MTQKLLTLLVASLLVHAGGTGQTAPEFGADDKARIAEEVRQEFLHAWKGYVQYAWGHDELKPLSKGSLDWYGVPFYLSALDALDTMVLMGLKDEADSTREFIATHLSFDKDVYVKHFEFTIRCLGSLLASYQLTGDQRLLRLAEDLGKRMLPVFRSPTGMPYASVNLRTGAVRDTLSNPAEIGTLLVEYGTLSALTDNPEFFNAAKSAYLQVFEARSEIGLVGDRINIMNGQWLSRDSHLGACIDSYYEYMVKSAYLFDDYDCSAMWRESLRAITAYLADTSGSRTWYGRADMETGARTATLTGALDAFFPAVLALAGKQEQAARSMEAFYAMWCAHGIEPEIFDYSRGAAKGPRYFLNPEIMESAYYLYHYTGSPRYLAMGKVFFDSLRTYCRTDVAYAQLASVVTKEKADRMESYFFAETLKYLYLLFAPPETLDFEEIIFNTEAHPIRRTW